MAELKDSGYRREFGTGAVRDTAEGKGRCDLMPLHQVRELLEVDEMLSQLEYFQRTGNARHLVRAIKSVVEEMYGLGGLETAMLEAAKQYEDGARKYSSRNWEKGIPCHCYLDSAVRHYLKWLRGDKDEPHDRAVIWNLLGLWWTVENLPEMDDLPFNRTVGGEI